MENKQMNKSDCLLDVKNLSIRFKTKKGYVSAVENLNFSINKGELLAIVGESGCGKSITSLSVMGLIEKPAKVTADYILLDGDDLTKCTNKEIRNLRGTSMSMIFQEPLTSLNPLLTIGYQLSEQFLTHNKTMTKQQAKEKSIAMLKKTGIPEPENVYSSYPNALSGGMRQRVMIAIAMACNPKLLIADEPTTALDVTIQAQILQLMRNLVSDYDTAIMFITHDLGVVAEMADRVIVMYAGQIVEQADVMTLFHKPMHPYTKGLLHSTVRVQDEKDVLDPIPGVVPSLTNMPKGCRFEPRCEFKCDKCSKMMPELKEVEPGHFVRCSLYNEEDKL